MPVDFRDPQKALHLEESPRMLAAPQRLVVLALWLSAVVMCGAGLWFWLRPPTWLDAQSAPFLGLALGATAVADVVAALFLRWHWSRTAP